MQVFKLFWMMVAVGWCGILTGAATSPVVVRAKERHVVVEHAEPQIMDDLSKYDTFNISDCLVIVKVKDEDNPVLITSFQVVGISTCLADAAAQVYQEKESKTTRWNEEKDNLETSFTNVWQDQGNGSIQAEQIHQNLTATGIFMTE